MSDDQVTIPRADLANIEHLLETLEEASLDAQRLLSAEDRGWAKLGSLDGEVIDRAAIMEVAKTARVMAVADPLIKRAISLRVAYLGSPSVGAAADDDGQDVNAVVQAFWDDPENAETLASVQACAERERARNTDGNVFLALPTDPRTGRTRVRVIPPEQVVDIITDPEDAATPWLYKRTYTAKRVTQNRLTGATSTASETRTVYYPDDNFRPATRARSIDGHEIRWDQPVVHDAVGRPSGSRWGVPDVLAALEWARGHRDFLHDWAKLHKALATVAFRASAKTKRGGAQVREKFSTAPTGDGVGGVAIHGEGQTFEAVNKSGATIDAGSSKPLAAMVAAATDLPVTMLLTDPGVTGARATAETLDRPLELERLQRRAIDTDLIRTILGHVVREAVRAPGGPLRGTITRDPNSQRETVTLAGEQPIDFTVDWPDLGKTDVKTQLEALDIASGLDVVDPLTIARLVLVALGVDDVDAELDAITDEDGAFVPPSSTTATAAQDPGYDGAGQPQD